MNRHAAILLTLSALLGSCARHTAATPGTAPEAAPAPGTTSVTAPPGRSQPVRPLGLVTVNFSGLTAPTGPEVTVSVPGGLTGSGLADLGSIQLKAASSGTFTTGTRGVDGVRYLYTTFLVRNATAGGAAYPTPRQNLTLIAASTPGTLNDTPFSSLKRFDGSDADPAIAPLIQPTTGLTFDPRTGRPGLLSGAQDLQVYAETEVAGISGVTRAFPFGFVTRNRTRTDTRTLNANPASTAFDGVVTVALKLPLQADVADDPYTFNMTFAVVDDTLTRVTESPEEQTAGDVAARATALGAQVAVLCGSTYSGTPLFIGSATTAGAPGTRAAHIGGDVALNTLPSAYAATGNATLTTTPASGLGRFYRVYPPTPGGATPTLTFSGNGSARGGTLSVNADGSFAFTSRAGDGAGATLTRGAGDTFTFSGGAPTADTLRYSLSTSTGCAGSNQTAPVNINGRVWFVNGAGAGGDGRQPSPFSTVSAAQAASGPSDLIHVASGTYSQPTTFTLKNAQAAVGAGTALNVNGSTLLTAGSAPIIQVTGGAGVTLASNNTLTGLSVQGSTDGITGTNFGTFNGTLTQVKASSGLALNLKSGAVNLSATRLDATNAATNGRGVNLEQVGGTLTVTGSGSAGSGGVIQTAASAGNIGIHLQPDTANLTVNLNRMTVQQNHVGVQFTPFSTASTGTLNLNVQDSSFLNNTAYSVYLNPTGNTSNTYLIRNNTFTHASTGNGITYEAQRPSGSISVDQGRIQNNTLSMAADGNANAIDLAQRVAGSGRFEISGNAITSFGLYGMQLRAMDSAARMDVILTNNTVSSPAGPATAPNADGIYLTSGITSGQTNVLCVKPTGNTSASPTAGNAGFALRQLGGGTFIIDTAAPSAAGVQTANNNSTVRVRNSATFAPVAGTCQAPN
ncbi:beta strand repeat-containing protein [Deinococcus xianganensis]|uniref:VcbS n=1 Tax=Deinococcus xianganensis TaxID=1507289 RepID=A0A6I4YRF9_9DEIO|nr:right-handed parallel beta-helix repeat-containing protein [Deinococcus xianganensis]MXV20145.1 VcbS [Deinococcus xianganensis]